MPTLHEPRIQRADLDGDDVKLLVKEMGQDAYFQDRMVRQEKDQGVLLIAWIGERVVGDVYVRWDSAEEPEIRLHLPGVPLLTHLEVHEDLRSRGIGTHLIARAEELLIRRKFSRVALAVEECNTRAVALYERCGYRDWALGFVHCHPYEDVSGGPQAVEVCRVFVKDLPAQN